MEYWLQIEIVKDTVTLAIITADCLAPLFDKRKKSELDSSRSSPSTMGSATGGGGPGGHAPPPQILLEGASNAFAPPPRF